MLAGNLFADWQHRRREARRQRDPQRRDVPYRTADVDAARLALRPFGSKCHACGEEPYGRPKYQRRYNRVYRSCTRERPWNDAKRGCGAVWYELPKDVEAPR